jgi:alpha-L-fucosidase
MSMAFPLAWTGETIDADEWAVMQKQTQSDRSFIVS